MEQVYGLKISLHLVKKLYWLKQREGVPMTVLVNQAITVYIAQKEQEGGELKDDGLQRETSTETPKGK